MQALSTDTINCPLKATESHYSAKLKCNIQSLMSDEVTLLCRVMLPTDPQSLIHLTQFTPISCSLQLSQWLTFSELQCSLPLLCSGTLCQAQLKMILPPCCKMPASKYNVFFPDRNYLSNVISNHTYRAHSVLQLLCDCLESPEKLK